MKRLIALNLTLLTGLLLCSAASAAATYKWIDEKGNVHYSQQRPEGSNYERLKVEKSRPGADDSTPAASTPEGSTKPAGSADSSATVKEELAKNKETREKNCEAAKKNLEIYTVHKRFKDKEGNVVRLDDDERATRVEQAKQNISEFCD